jgi:hypothetical protein
MAGGRSASSSSVHSSTLRSRPEPDVHNRNFSSGGPSQHEGETGNDERRRNRRLFFGLIRY